VFWLMIHHVIAYSWNSFCGKRFYNNCMRIKTTTENLQKKTLINERMDMESFLYKLKRWDLKLPPVLIRNTSGWALRKLHLNDQRKLSQPSSSAGAAASSSLSSLLLHSFLKHSALKSVSSLIFFNSTDIAICLRI